MDDDFFIGRKNHLELSELKNMLTKTENFLSEQQFNLGENRRESGDETTGLLDGELPLVRSGDVLELPYVPLVRSGDVLFLRPRPGCVHEGTRGASGGLVHQVQYHRRSAG